MNNEFFSDEDKLNQAVKHIEASNFIDAESLVKEVLRNNQNNPRALNMAGSIAYKVGKIDMALPYFNQAYKIAPNNSAIVANLGTCFAASKDTYDKAKICFKKALTLNPDDVNAICEYCILEIKMMQFENSETLMEHAVSLEDNATVNGVYGKVLWNIGDFERAIPYLEKSLSQYKAFDVLQTFVTGCITFYKLDLAEEIIEQNLGNGLYKDYEEAKLNIYLVIIKMLRNDYVSANALIDKADDIKNILAIERPSDVPSQVWMGLFIYYLYLRYILKYYEQHEQKGCKEGAYSQELYLVGDSHTLSAANTIIQYDAVMVHCNPRLIIGVKIYHLIKEGSNNYKSAFLEHFKMLPDASNVVVMVGEIDCRAGEGIITYYKKNPDIDLDDYIEAMIRQYVLFILSLAEDKKHRIIFYGVPAPRKANISITTNTNNKNHPAPTEEDVAKQVQIVNLYNTYLKKYAELNDCKFLDVYNYTSDMQGISSGTHHLDTNHLYPHVFGGLFR